MDQPYDTQFLDKLPAGVMVLKNRNIVFVNQKARNDLGYFEKQNKKANDLFIQFIAPSYREEFKKVLSSESPLPEESEWQALLPDGKPTWVQFRVANLSEEYELVFIRN